MFESNREGASNRTVLTALALVALTSAVAGAMLMRDKVRPEPESTYWEAPAFALVDQQGDTLRSTELRGTPWVASFIFTNCTGVCPLITRRMATVRDSLAAAGLLGPGGARLVSFSVDPARDTPEVLRAYAGNYGGSPPEQWAFLTGTPPEAVLRLIQDGFRLSAVGPPEGAAGEGDYQVNHSPRIAVVDGDGMIHGLYRGPEPTAVDSVLAGVRALLR